MWSKAQVPPRCATITQNGPWRAADTEAEAFVAIDGGAQRRIMRFGPATAMFLADILAQGAGIYEVEARGWIAASNNAGIAHATFFVHTGVPT